MWTTVNYRRVSDLDMKFYLHPISPTSRENWTRQKVGGTNPIGEFRPRSEILFSIQVIRPLYYFRGDLTTQTEITDLIENHLRPFGECSRTTSQLFNAIPLSLPYSLMLPGVHP